MRILFSLTLLVVPWALCAQEKGVSPSGISSTAPNKPPANVWAVVTGVSDYQDVYIPDLRFADKDAEAFVNFLRSPAGGNIPETNIVLLTNEQATNARFAASLDWLLEVVGEGDQVIIYFSGHGDVETHTRSQLGFLLLWDSPPTNYKAGAYSVFYLQDIISTISIDKKARISVITDACHAGKLAGSSIGGTQATAQALSQQFANEVKIMSCQPNEFSLEGEQWGQGRGAFSFHLLDGLYGLADLNDDGIVLLKEIARYLEDRVPEETAPHPQTPLTLGDRNAWLANVDAAALANLVDEKKKVEKSIALTSNKGLADGLLADSDSLTLALYRAFEKALAAGNLMGSSGNDPSADAWYQKILELGTLKPLHGLMRRNLAVALQDQVQQAINALLADDPYEVNHFIYNPAKYSEYPLYLQRAIELLGEDHYMYPVLRSKQFFFESYLITQHLGAQNVSRAFQDSIRPVVQQKLKEAMALDSTSGYLHHAFAQTFYYVADFDVDSVGYWLESATRLSPQWLLPYLELAFLYQAIPGKEHLPEYWMKIALDIRPNSYHVRERLSWLYQWHNKTDESLALSDQMIAERPELFNAYSTAAVTCIMRKEYDRAEKYIDQSLAIDANPNNWANQYKIILLTRTRRWEIARSTADSLFNQSQVNGSARGAFIYYLLDALIYNRQYELASMVVDASPVIETSPWHVVYTYAVKGIRKMGKGDFPAARVWLQEMVDTMPFDHVLKVWQWHFEALMAESEGNAQRADSFFQAGLQFDYTWFANLENRVSGIRESLRYDYGCFLLRQQRDAEAWEQFSKNLEEEPLAWRSHLGIAVYQSHKGKYNEALHALERALVHWLPTPELSVEEPMLGKLRKTKRFKALIEQNFPNASFD